MNKAQILDGVHKNPIGLRQRYEVAAVLACITLNMIQKLIGHSDITTIADYAKVLKESERIITAQMWI